MKVLLVEDEIDLLVLIRTILIRAGIECDTAATLDGARSQLRETEYQAVLLDLLLAGETGWALVDELRSKSGPPVIVISAYASEETRQRVAEAGCEWVPKPFKIEELRGALARAVDTHNAS